MDKNKHHLFVYGSLRSGFKQPAYEYISKYFSLLGDAKVKGVLYDMGTYPVAVSSNDEKYIFGELYSLKNENEFSWAFSQLDDYEGVNTEDGDAPLYRRDETMAYLDDQILPSYIYWFNGDVTGKPMIASGDVADYFQQSNNH